MATRAGQLGASHMAGRPTCNLSQHVGCPPFLSCAAGYSIFSSVAITGQDDVTWNIASGPLQVGGWGAGGAGGAFCSGRVCGRGSRPSACALRGCGAQAAPRAPPHACTRAKASFASALSLSYHICSFVPGHFRHRRRPAGGHRAGVHPPVPHAVPPPHRAVRFSPAAHVLFGVLEPAVGWVGGRGGPAWVRVAGSGTGVGGGGGGQASTRRRACLPPACSAQPPHAGSALDAPVLGPVASHARVHGPRASPNPSSLPQPLPPAPSPAAGGALGALFVGLVASNSWEKGFPKWGSLGRSYVFSPESEWAPGGGCQRLAVVSSLGGCLMLSTAAWDATLGCSTSPPRE